MSYRALLLTNHNAGFEVAMCLKCFIPLSPKQKHSNHCLHPSEATKYAHMCRHKHLLQLPWSLQSVLQFSNGMVYNANCEIWALQHKVGIHKQHRRVNIGVDQQNMWVTSALELKRLSEHYVKVLWHAYWPSQPKWRRLSVAFVIHRWCLWRKNEAVQHKA